MRDMDLLREFLESSTIHGLAYISTAKVDWRLILSNLFATSCLFGEPHTRSDCLYRKQQCLVYLNFWKWYQCTDYFQNQKGADNACYNCDYGLILSFTKLLIVTVKNLRIIIHIGACKGTHK